MRCAGLAPLTATLFALAAASAQEVHFSPEEQLDAIDATLIATAKLSIDFASYALTDPIVIAALDEIRAAIAAGAERVVMTSSVSAVNEAGVEGVADETRWTDPAAKGVSAYAQSKTLAERAAWKLIGETGGATTLTTILPVLVVGPVMSGDFSGSILAISRMLNGAMPGIPNLGFNYVDVRDVADLHLRAMLSPAAVGQRFIAYC